jgi:nucleotide-binding universal stress UspA family protein
MLRTGEPVVAVGRSANRSASLTRRGPTAQTRDRIVACVDGQPPAESIVGVAAAWADALDMSLTVVTVAEPSPAPDRDDVPWRRSHGPSQDADAYMSELAARWDDVAPDMNAVAVYDPINPASGLQAWLKEHPAGLLAVTTHARSGLGRVVLGATAAAIVRVSPVPVLVVPLR